jgi:hypothetical protein
LDLKRNFWHLRYLPTSARAKKYITYSRQ